MRDFYKICLMGYIADVHAGHGDVEDTAKYHELRSTYKCTNQFF